MTSPDNNIRNPVPDTDAAFFSALSEACGKSFLTAVKQARAVLSEKDVIRWVSMGKKISRSFPEAGELVQRYFDSSAPFFCEQGFDHLKDWVNAGIRIGKLSTGCAVDFFAATPEFLENARFPQINQLASDAVRIFDFDHADGKTVSAFLKTSGNVLRFLTPRVYKIWRETGCLLLRQSGKTASRYFSLEPEGLDRLYLSEITKIFKITGIASTASHQQAVDFYQSAPGLIRRINPNLRDAVLEKIIDLSSGKPGDIINTFDDIVLSLTLFSNPVQETIVRLDNHLIEISTVACRAYYRHIRTVLSVIPVFFLGNWVEKGVSLLRDNPDDGLAFFRLKAPAAAAELEKWGSAAFLENNREMLSVFCHALCGEKIRVRSTDELNPADKNRLGLKADENGFTFYLAPYVAEENNAEANLAFYKVAAALKAGYLEFGTLSPEFAGIWSFLESFPDKELALEIFHLLEDGRIFRNLRKHYPGLAPEIDRVIGKSMFNRPVTRDGLLDTALEWLLRLCLEYPVDVKAPEPLASAGMFLQEQVSDFHLHAENVLASYKKTALIYDTLSVFSRRKTPKAIVTFSLPMNGLPDGPAGDGLEDVVPDRIVAADEAGPGDNITLTPEELERLLDMTQDMTLLSSLDFTPSARGLYLSDLDDFTVSGDPEAGAGGPDKSDQKRRIKARKAVAKSRSQKQRFFYDEWDYLAEEYRSRWCCLRERDVPRSDPDLYHRIYTEYGDLIRKVRFQFQRIRPASLDIIHNVDQGDEIDLTALIRSVVDKKAGTTPSERVFCRKDKKVRHMSTLLLIDMSASTEDRASDVSGPDQSEAGRPDSPAADKRVIDIEKESLIVMSEALDVLGDQYAMYGFSGRGRENVDYYVIKAFEEANSEHVKMRICGIEPKQSTRMGTAIRHATAKLSCLEADHRLLILLSDGFPQDLDYGEDRKSREYGLNDTMMAFIEAKRLDIKPFCITIDQAGNDYLKKMCAPEEYLIIRDIAMLPELLPGIVESLMG